MGLSRLLSATLSGLLVLPAAGLANPFETTLQNGPKLKNTAPRR